MSSGIHGFPERFIEFAGHVWDSKAHESPIRWVAKPDVYLHLVTGDAFSPGTATIGPR